MHNYQKDIADQIDLMPIDQARMMIASGRFGSIGSPAHAFASSWLSAREANLRDAREKDLEIKYQAGEPLLTVDAWKAIEKEYGITKRSFAKKINFIQDQFKRIVIFRDIAQAYLLANHGFNKPSVILAGGVIEELLRLYLSCKNVNPSKNKLDAYIKACEDNGLLKSAIHKLADSVRQFRNIVHLERESSAKHTISKATAKGALSSVFTIANDLT
ncbi:MAG TPA: hypothetical protein PLO63_02550 [Syntrophales bacterium]|nr:hypothetical protein [Syntrophales bacterium]